MIVIAKLIPLFIIISTLFGCSLKTARDYSPPPEELIALGDYQYSEQNYSEALDYYLTALDYLKDKPELYYKIGMVYGIKKSLEQDDNTLVREKRHRLDRRRYREDSHHNNAIYYFRKGAVLGHQPSREILRVLYDNIQHQDVKY